MLCSAEVKADVNNEQYEVTIYPVEDEYVCELTVNESTNPSNASSRSSAIMPETYIILDRSGSMGWNVEKLTNRVLPLMLEKLSYQSNHRIHLIAFDDKIKYFNSNEQDLRQLQLSAAGGTEMSGALKKLKQLLELSDKRKPVRVLTISDGLVDDPTKVAKIGAELKEFVSLRQTPINSQAVRLFTSYSQPDTTALCNVLQINNVTSSTLIDVPESATTEEMATQMANLFNSDCFVNGMTLTAELPILFSYPWDVEPVDKLMLVPGKNVFWLKKMPKSSFKVAEEIVKVTSGPMLNLAKFHQLLDTKFDLIMNHLKILKIVASDAADVTISKIAKYFENMENILVKEQTNLINATSSMLNIRMRKIIAGKRKMFSNLIANIANDNKVSKLNSAQKADYLREVASTKGSRGLARRAAKEGLDFDETARSEVLAMAKFIGELNDIDDTTHNVSFFSQDTTLGGIKALIEMSECEVFESLEASDILEVLNLVGVACSGPISAFPDPMQWKVNEIYLGCYVSLSDVLVAHSQSNGQSLLVPATNEVITNVIPIFDDPRIGKFMRKHAPSLLEYTFSIGMRRMIADVPMTIGYTMCAGIWKMVQEINKNASSLHLEVFEKFVTSFDNFVGKYFDHVRAFIKPQSTGKYSYYIGHHSIGEMINPMFRIYKEKDAESIKLIPNILRSLYSFEAWRCVRRSSYQAKESWEDIARSMLHKLLGLDLQKDRIAVKPLFEEEPNLEDIKFTLKPKIDYKYVNELYAMFGHINHVALIPMYFEALTNGSIEAIKTMPELSYVQLLESLEIKYDFQKFLFFTVFQTLRFTTRANRELIEQEKMKMVDLIDEQEATKEVQKYIKSELKAQYLSDLAKKHEEESKSMGVVAAKKILSSQTYEEMVSVWRSGVVVNSLTYKIQNSMSNGFKLLCQELCNPDSVVPLRAEMIKILLLGTDDKNEPVWNNGGACCGLSVTPFKQVLIEHNQKDRWIEILEEYSERKGQMHVYRADLLNRHGHGNEKPSFWAIGHLSLAVYRENVSDGMFKSYCREHQTCCGVYQLGQAFLLTL